MLYSIHTIGHSTRSIDEFLELLGTHAIRRLVDIRRYPGSRRFPHFGSAALAQSLDAAGIVYEHCADLGGRRRPSPDSPNKGWRNDAFRAYADYMATPEFRSAIDRLLASESSTVIMCAEAVPWRCHRSLIGDALLIRGAAQRRRASHHRLRHGERPQTQPDGPGPGRPSDLPGGRAAPLMTIVNGRGR